MNPTRLKKALLFAAKVYVWVELHFQDGVWLNVPKRVIYDYLEDIPENTEFLAELKDDNLFLGKES